MPGRFSAIFTREITFVTVCLPAHQAHSEKRSFPKGSIGYVKGNKSFPFRADPFSDGR